MENPTESVTYEVSLTYGLPSPLPQGWIEKFGHLSITTERVERVERDAAHPGRLSIELSVMPLDLTAKSK